MGERRYTEKEISEILRSASDLQSSASTASDSMGLTLPELQRLAEEVGIHPTYISTSASKLEIEPTPRFRVGGAARSLVQERIVDGEVDDSKWEEIVVELRTAFQSVGSVSNLAMTREWTGGSHWSEFHVSATPKEGRTRIRIAVNQTDGMLVVWLLALVAALMGSLAAYIGLSNGGASITLAGMLVAIGVVYIVAYIVLAKWNLRHEKALDSAMAGIEALISDRRPSALEATLSDSLTQAQNLETHA